MNQDALIKEAMHFLAAKLAADRKEEGIVASREDVAAAVEANWPKIAENIAKLVAAAEGVA